METSERGFGIPVRASCQTMGGDMRRIALCVLSATCLLLVGVQYMPAQESLLRADIPFKFVVQGSTLPSGTYILSKSSAVESVLILKSADFKEGILFRAMEEPPVSNGSPDCLLTFDLVHDTHFLRSIQMGSWDDSYAIAEPNAERELLSRKSDLEQTQLAAIRY
jgi:hypothetical protein